MCAFIQCLHNAYKDGCHCNFHLKQFNSMYKKYRSQCISNSTTTVPTFWTTQRSIVTSTVNSKCQGSYSTNLYKTCSVFGSWHLRTFDEGLESCTTSVSPAQSGSWPVVKNKHFTVQGSFHTVTQDVAALRMNKVWMSKRYILTLINNSGDTLLISIVFHTLICNLKKLEIRIT